MGFPLPPRASDIRVALIDIISNDVDVADWLNSGNPKGQIFSLDLGEFSIFDVPAEELAIRLQVLGVSPASEMGLFYTCADFVTRVTVWVYYHAMGSTLAHEFLGVVEAALQGRSMYTATHQSRTVQLRDIIFVGRAAQQALSNAWGIPSIFRMDCRYV